MEIYEIFLILGVLCLYTPITKIANLVCDYKTSIVGYAMAVMGVTILIATAAKSAVILISGL